MFSYINTKFITKLNYNMPHICEAKYEGNSSMRFSMGFVPKVFIFLISFASHVIKK